MKTKKIIYTVTAVFMLMSFALNGYSAYYEWPNVGLDTSNTQTVLYGAKKEEAVYFNSADLEFKLGLSEGELVSITVLSLPKAEEGKLTIGKTDVKKDDCITRVQINELAFVPAKDAAKAEFTLLPEASDSVKTTLSINLYEKDNLAQQMELVRREAADGAGAVILEPVDELECRQYLEENTYGTPIILLGELSPDEEVKGAVHMDWTAAGRKLGEAITAEQSPDLPVWIFADNPYIGKAGEMKQGLTEVLEKQGFSYTIVPRGTDDTYRSVIEKTVYPGSGTAVVAALDFASTAEAAEIVGGSSVYGKYISGLYGVGMMPSLLDQLDKGTIRGLVVTNQFDAGYFAVKKAVQAIEKEQERSQLSLESYYIEKDELRSKKYEKMLYPID